MTSSGFGDLPRAEARRPVPVGPDTPEQRAIDAEGTARPPFYAVSPAKLAVLSVTTLGLYELIWFYKNWKAYAANTGAEVSPFWRTVFSIFYCAPLASAVGAATRSAGLGSRLRPLALGIAYAALTVGVELPGRLEVFNPPALLPLVPFALIASLFTFLPLVPIAREIRRLRLAETPDAPLDTGFGWLSWTVSLVGGVLAFLVVATGFGPPTRILRGDELPSSYLRTLVAADLVEAGEDIDFFYSSGLFSIAEDGNMLTARRVISYELGETGIDYASADYGEIAEVQVLHAGFLGDSIATVTTDDGDIFALFLSTEDDLDEEALETLEARIAVAGSVGANALDGLAPRP